MLPFSASSQVFDADNNVHRRGEVDVLGTTSRWCKTIVASKQVEFSLLNLLLPFEKTICDVM